MLLWNTCKNQLLILFYFLQFGVNSTNGQKNTLYITYAFIKEKIIPGGNCQLPFVYATTMPKIRVVNKDKTFWKGVW